jgi:outer membrane biosynthesis protein TonB
MDKSDVMKLVKRGPHPTSCWAWRGLLAEGGFPTVTKGKIEDPAVYGLGAPSVQRLCKNRLCVNPKHRDGAQEAPLLPAASKPRPKPNTKARTLKLVSKQTEAKATKSPIKEPVKPTPPVTPVDPPVTKVEPKPKPTVTPKPKTSTKAKLKPRKKTVSAPKPKTAKTHCNQGHPWVEANIWTSPSTGKTKCKSCLRETKARFKAKKKAATR